MAAFSKLGDGPHKKASKAKMEPKRIKTWPETVVLEAYS
jgi:hypothetical protein